MKEVPATIIEYTYTITTNDTAKKPSSILARETGLSQQSLKTAMQKGAVWLHQSQRCQRLRRNNKPLHTGDQLQLFYNTTILNQEPPAPSLISDEKEYSIWYKPYGLFCQGSKWGDACTINRWVETHLHPQRPCFLVHRLDQATTGIILLAHSKKTAQIFSHFFSTRTIQKHYQAIVKGNFSAYPSPFEINTNIEGKKASTTLSYAATTTKNSLVNIQLHTGRKHQIRIHLSQFGFPIIGDRLYGQALAGDKNLQLQAVKLAFKCPLTKEHKTFQVPETLQLVLEE
jgi:tRNA pseudouridine32 synthase/23S rRNA pseudouridine746 synthase